MSKETVPPSPEPVPTRESYERPELVEIELEAEQVLAVGCKNPTGAPALGGEPACGIASGCNAQGS